MRKIIQLFDPFHYLAGRRQTGLLVSANFHIANTTTDVLQNVFGNRIIGHGFWSSRSPDLTSSDFFLWDFLKERLYSNNTTSLEDFKHNNEGILVALINKIFYKLQGKNAAKKWTLFFQRVGGKFQHLS